MALPTLYPFFVTRGSLLHERHIRKELMRMPIDGGGLGTRGTLPCQTLEQARNGPGAPPRPSRIGCLNVLENCYALDACN